MSSKETKIKFSHTYRPMSPENESALRRLTRNIIPVIEREQAVAEQKINKMPDSVIDENADELANLMIQAAKEKIGKRKEKSK